MVQTGKRKQFSLLDLDLWPTNLTYNLRLAKVKVDPHAENQGQRSNGSNRKTLTDKRTDTHTDATKRHYRPCCAVDNDTGATSALGYDMFTV